MGIPAFSLSCMLSPLQRKRSFFSIFLVLISPSHPSKQLRVLFQLLTPHKRTSASHGSSLVIQRCAVHKRERERVAADSGALPRNEYSPFGLTTPLSFSCHDLLLCFPLCPQRCFGGFWGRNILYVSSDLVGDCAIGPFPLCITFSAVHQHVSNRPLSRWAHGISAKCMHNEAPSPCPQVPLTKQRGMRVHYLLVFQYYLTDYMNVSQSHTHVHRSLVQINLSI